MNKKLFYIKSISFKLFIIVFSISAFIGNQNIFACLPPPGDPPPIPCGGPCGDCQECQDNQCVPVKCKDPNNDPAKSIDPVVLRTLEYQYTKRDFLIPGRVMPIEIIRTYRNQSENDSPFGYGWDLNYNIKITRPTETDKLLLSNGRNNILRYNLISTNPNKYISPKGTYDYIIENSDGTFILSKKYGDTLYFDSTGNLQEIQDRTGNNSITFEYDAQNRLYRIFNDLGRSVTFAYYSDRWTITDFNDRTWTYRYDSQNNLHTVTDPNNLITTYNYSSHNLTSITDANNKTWAEVFYDVNDKVYKQRYGNPEANFYFNYNTDNETLVKDQRDINTLTAFNDAGLPLYETIYTSNPKLRASDPNYYQTRYSYDSKMNLIRKTFPRGNCIIYDYDDNGNILTMTIAPCNGEQNRIIHFTYDSKYNFVKTLTDSKDNVTTYDYNSINGNLEKITYPEVYVIDGTGSIVKASPVVTMTYNIYGQIKTITNPDGIENKYEYYETDLSDPNYGRLKRITIDDNDVNGFDITTEYKYDILGNVIEVNDPNKNITQFAYNILGKISKITDANSNITSYFYDNCKQISTIKKPIADTNQITKFTYDILDKIQDFTNPLGYVTKYGYDKGQNQADINDAERNNTHYDYDERNLLWKVTDANGGTTTYNYTINGEVNDVIDANGNKTEYRYDGHERLVRIIYPDSSNERFSYDKNNNITSKINRNDETINYEYDAMDRLVTKTRPGEPNMVFRYDIAGKIVEVNDHRDISDGGGITKYKYDRIGRVSEINDITGKIIKYNYEERGLRITLVYPDDSNVDYEYDALDRVKNVKYKGETVATYLYDALGRRTKVTYGNGASISYQYDIGNRLTQIINDINGVKKIDFNYANYDKVGNHLSCKKDTAETQVYAYDKLYQISDVDYNDGNKTWYKYDKLGNRTKMTVNTSDTIYDSNALNQYIRVDSENYQYDKNGNLVDDGASEYYYDCENRLTDVNNAEDEKVVSYKYDYEGRRIQKTVDGEQKTEIYLYDGDQIIADYNDSNILQRKYIFGPGIDEPICMIDAASGNMYYYHYDGLGNVVALSGISRFKAIAAGKDFSLAIKGDGSIAQWGSGLSAQPPSGYDFVAIAAGEHHALALRNNGSIVGWGGNTYGEANSPAGNNFVAIAAGGFHSLALRSEGNIVGWGCNVMYGQQWNQATPPPGNDFAAIAAGYFYSLALKNDGSIEGWGFNGQGQTTPPSGYDFMDISATGAQGFFSTALRNDGTIAQWGLLPSGSSLPDGNNFIDIATGYYHTIALTKEGSLVSWGADTGPYYVISTTPVGNEYIDVAAGFYHSLALRKDSFIVGWGGNYQGQATPPAPIVKIVETYSYDVFGKPTIKDVNGTIVTASSYGNRFMFTGREYDYETGNYYYRARTYKPSIGRFLQTDPIGYAGGLNLYSYVNNNPLNWIDPWGLCNEPAEAGTQLPNWIPPEDRGPFGDYIHDEKGRDGRGGADDYSNNEMRKKYEEWKQNGKPGMNDYDKQRRRISDPYNRIVFDPSNVSLYPRPQVDLRPAVYTTIGATIIYIIVEYWWVGGAAAL